MSKCTCPTCGQFLSGAASWDYETRRFFADGSTVRLSKTQANIVDVLWQSIGRGGVCSADELLQRAYADDRNGGPLSPSTISVHLMNIRRKLEAVGWTVSKNMGTPRIGYQIQKLSNSLQAAE